MRSCGGGESEALAILLRLVRRRRCFFLSFGKNEQTHESTIIYAAIYLFIYLFILSIYLVKL